MRNGTSKGPAPARRRADWPSHYSQRNCLILEASGASEVAGYREWQALGRQVRKGEHGLQIGAPIVVKDRDTGEPKMVNVGTATVFDVSQTDAVEVPA